MDENAINDYMNWVDESTSKTELIDTLYDIKNDIESENDDEDNSGRAYIYKR